MPCVFRASRIEVTSSCDSCGRCVELCPYGVLVLEAGRVVAARIGECRCCLGCMAICHAAAIRVGVEWVCGENGLGRE